MGAQVMQVVGAITGEVFNTPDFHCGLNSVEVGEERLAGQVRHTQRLELIGKLTAGLLHDINNLLTIISGCTTLLMDEGGSSGSQLEYAKDVHEAAERACALTSQFLRFGRSRRSQNKPVNLNQTVIDAVKLLRRTLGGNIEILTDLEPMLGWIMADPIYIEQVIINLAVNARDAMGRGGTLTLKTETVTTAVDTDQEKPTFVQYSRLSIHDTGTGMDQQTKAKIFDPFFTTKEPGKGTGMGLSIVRDIVREAKGEIRVESELGNGTTFEIYFPTSGVYGPATEGLNDAMELGRSGDYCSSDVPRTRTNSASVR
ncbi:MAG: hypothetical protein JO323_23935 [Acidobacteriia bacterium]|nr:hypothetical protein [Terriglobia bacterium]